MLRFCRKREDHEIVDKNSESVYEDARTEQV
jgi:hypothetical protein